MKRRIVSLILILLLSITSISVPVITFAEDADLIMSESYNQYVTNEVLYDITSSSLSQYVREYKEGEKGLFLSTFKTGGSVTYSFKADSNLFVTFDVMSTADNLVGALKIADASNQATTAIKFARYNQITTANGRHIGGYSKNGVTNVGIAVNNDEGKFDLYINRKCIRKNEPMMTKKIATVAQLSFSFEADSDENQEAGVILDNINVHKGNTFLKSYPVAQYNDESVERPVIKEDGTAAGGKIMDFDFSTEPNFKMHAKTNILERADKDNGNWAMYCERTSSSDAHADVNGIASTSDYVVYEYDFKVLDVPKTAFVVWLKDINANYSRMATVKKGGELALGTFSTKLTEGMWYNVATVYNYYDRTRDYYLNGALVLENDPIEAVLGNAADIDIIRFNLEGDKDYETNVAKFLIDNIKVYETKEPMEDISGLKRTIEIDPALSSLDSEKPYQKLLDGYTALHTRSGVVVHKGTKSVLSHLPEGIGSESFVPAAELCELLGVSYKDGAQPVVNGKSVAEGNYKTVDGLTYVNAKYLFETSLGKQVFIEDTTKSHGMLIAGETKFVPPTDATTLQLFNNYVFYERPDVDKVAAAYESSSVNGEHPRIQATAADFARLKEEIKTNPYKKMLADRVFEQADKYLADPKPVWYVLTDGTRLLNVSRKVLNTMYCLGMAYQLTGDMKYVDRAWIDLKAVSEFSDWHPIHALDPAEMGAAVAIGYDWMYHAFTPEQRAVIEEGVFNNFFYVAANSYQYKKGQLVSAFNTEMNHNLIVSSGVGITAMAFMDVYPEISTYLLSRSIHSIGKAIVNYGPEGAWVEGPHYWEYSTQYTTKYLSSLDSVLGTSFGLDLTQGLDIAAEFILKTQSDVGIFNYGDGNIDHQFVPEILWLANKYGLKDVPAALVNLSQLKYANQEDNALFLLWLDPAVQDGTKVNMPLDAFYPGENVATFRDAWSSEPTTFVGVHGGKTIVNHSHLDGGSFVFDSMGVRWAQDPGSPPYDLPGAWDTVTGGRWKMYMTRAEAHNSVVINPDGEPDHNPNSTVYLVRNESKNRGAIAVTDTTELYTDDAVKARRGFFFTDNRKSLVIRDEFTLKKDSEVYWFMQTAADISIVEDGAILSSEGRHLKLDFVASHDAEISYGISEPLPTSPIVAGDKLPGMKRIAIKMKASGDSNITVKLTPYGASGSAVEEYNRSIDTWQIPDGDIPEPPVLGYATADGEPIVFDEGKSAILCVAGGKNAVYPKIEAVVDTSKYSLQISESAPAGIFTMIKVIDNQDPTNTAQYTVTYRAIPVPQTFEGMTSIQITDLKVSSEPQPVNHVYNLFDSDFSTKWAVEGENEWVELELLEESVVDNLMISFTNGKVRQEMMSIAVSVDGVNYETVYDGLSIGGTDEFETHVIGGKRAKYVKLGFHGNSQTGRGGWASVAEVVLTKNN